MEGNAPPPPLPSLDAQFCEQLADNSSQLLLARNAFWTNTLLVIALPTSRFAAAAWNLIPLPAGPTLSLPGGLLGVLNGGRVFVHGRWVVALGIAPDLFVVLDRCSERHTPRVLLEQVTGYLAACGAEVLRARIRFPIGWHSSDDIGRTIAYWVHHFVRTFSVSLEARLDLYRPRLALPIGDLARVARQEWLFMEAILRSAEQEHPELSPQFEWLLWAISHQWEIRWSLMLRDAEKYDSISLEERAALEECDRTWVVLVRHYLDPRGYKMLAETVARLL